MKHWVEEDKEMEQQEELWLDLVRGEEGMITVLLAAWQVFGLEFEPSS